MLKPPTDKITAETREKLLALAEFIETDRSAGFYMGIWLAQKDSIFQRSIDKSDAPECGTAACMGGHYELMTGKNPYRDLDLTSLQADALFYPDDGWCSSNDRTKAVRVLRHFAYTGEVDWSV